MVQRDIDNFCREALIEKISQLLENENIPHERISDFGTLAVEVPYEVNGASDCRWMVIKAIAPCDQSSEWLDQQIYGYEDRVAKREEKAKKAAQAKSANRSATTSK